MCDIICYEFNIWFDRLSKLARMGSVKSARIEVAQDECTSFRSCTPMSSMYYGGIVQVTEIDDGISKDCNWGIDSNGQIQTLHENWQTSTG